jgi:hypothetical protein
MSQRRTSARKHYFNNISRKKELDRWVSCKENLNTPDVHITCILGGTRTCFWWRLNCIVHLSNYEIRINKSATTKMLIWHATQETKLQGTDPFDFPVRCGWWAEVMSSYLMKVAAGQRRGWTWGSWPQQRSPSRSRRWWIPRGQTGGRHYRRRTATRAGGGGIMLGTSRAWTRGASSGRHGDARPCRWPRRQSGGRRRWGTPVVDPDAVALVAELVAL